MFVSPQNPHVEIRTPKWRNKNVGPFGVAEDMRAEPSWMGLGADNWDPFRPPREDTMGSQPSVTQRGLSPDPDCAGTLNSFQPPELWEINFYRVYATVLWHFVTAVQKLRPSSFKNCEEKRKIVKILGGE